MIKIIDDFFDDPDSVVSLSETMEFSLKNPQWPGVRTQDLRKHAPNVKDMFVKHICDNYPRLNPFELNRDFRSGFQKITSFSKDQLYFLSTEQLSSKPNETMSGIFNFLGLPGHTLSEFKKEKKAIYPEMNISTRNDLLEFFKSYNNELFSLIDKNFSWDK